MFLVFLTDFRTVFVLQKKKMHSHIDFQMFMNSSSMFIPHGASQFPNFSYDFCFLP